MTPVLTEFSLDAAAIVDPSRLAPLELISTYSNDQLDDLDYRAHAVTFGWHDGEKSAEDVAAIAAAVPGLTAELRRLRCK